jgi:hypothetical protein
VWSSFPKLYYYNAAVQAVGLGGNKLATKTLMFLSILILTEKAKKAKTAKPEPPPLPHM